MKIFISLVLLILVFSSCHKAPTQQSYAKWKPYSKEALLDAVKRHSPVIIDFSAEWCPNCHELDDTVFSRRDVQSKLDQVTTLRMDATNQDDSAVQAILQQYGIEGVPTIVFLDRQGKEVDNARIIGLVTPKEFLEAFALLKIFK